MYTLQSCIIVFGATFVVVQSNVCLHDHLEPVSGGGVKCNVSTESQRGNCATEQYCVSTWSGGLCCQHRGGKKPVCPDGGTLQAAPMGASCASNIDCNVELEKAQAAQCLTVDASGYQNTAGDAKFCCIPVPEEPTAGTANATGGTAANGNDGGSSSSGGTDPKSTGGANTGGATDGDGGGSAGNGNTDGSTNNGGTGDKNEDNNGAAAQETTTITTTPAPTTTTTATPTTTTTAAPTTTTTLEPTVPKTCVWSHLEPTGGPTAEPKSCTFSAASQKGSCQEKQFCVSSDGKDGICCQPTGGRPPVCPWGGSLQYAPMGVLCLTDANCNLNGEWASPNASVVAAKCVVGDARGYQNQWGTARFCCIPNGGGVPTVLAAPVPMMAVPTYDGTLWIAGVPHSSGSAQVYAHEQGGYPYQYNPHVYPNYYSGFAGAFPGYAFHGSSVAGYPLLARRPFGRRRRRRRQWIAPSYMMIGRGGAGVNADPMMAGALTGSINSMSGMMPTAGGSLSILANAEVERIRKKDAPKPEQSESGGGVGSLLGSLAGAAIKSNPYVMGGTAILGMLGKKK